jgi:hypothetical protein
VKLGDRNGEQDNARGEKGNVHCIPTVGLFEQEIANCIRLALPMLCSAVKIDRP